MMRTEPRGVFSRDEPARLGLPLERGRCAGETPFDTVFGIYYDLDGDGGTPTFDPAAETGSATDSADHFAERWFIKRYWAYFTGPCGKALAAMMDGSVRELPMDPATLDRRMPDAQIGRFAPTGSTLYLAEPPEP